MNRIYSLVAALILLLVKTAGALDGRRQGFFYQVGIGGGTTSADQEWTVLDTDFELDDSAGGIALDLKIGYGITSKLLLSYSINVGSADLETIDGQITGFSKSKETASFGAGGVGLTYFVKDAAPSLFVDLAVGVSHLGRRGWQRVQRRRCFCRRRVRVQEELDRRGRLQLR